VKGARVQVDVLNVQIMREIIEAAYAVVNAHYPSLVHAAGGEPEIVHLRRLLYRAANSQESAK
jgi:hypothetical protein